MVIYKKLNLHISAGMTPKQKIQKIEEIITELFTNALTNINEGNIMEYDLDTGQTRTRVKYNSQDSVLGAIRKYEDLKQLYINQMLPRQIRLVDEKNFRNRR
jgi:hypothetical protein